MNKQKNNLLTFKDIALLTFLSNFGVRWFAIAAGLGAQSISLWALGALLFFIPLAFISAHLSRLYPNEEGGVYAWTKHALGEKYGFIVAWLYVINNIFYYPAILIFLSANLAYFIGKPALANNSTFIVITVLVAFWFIVIMSLRGLKANKLITEWGGLIGTIIPTLTLIVLAFICLYIFKHSATSFNLSSFIPNKGLTNNLQSLSIIMFAMAGVEIIPTFANSVKKPKRDLYFGLIIGSIAIVTFYILGTASLNIILDPSQVEKTSGFIHAIQLISIKLHIPWLTGFIAFLLIFAELAAISIWLIAPVTMFFKCTPKGILPAWLQKTNKNDAPANALISIGILVTIVVFTTNLLPTIGGMYQLLVLMATILYFIPYLILIPVYLKSLKKLKNKIQLLPKILSSVIFISLILGIAFSFEPPHKSNWSSEVLYEIELVFGAVFFIWLGFFIYNKRKNQAHSSNKM